MRDSTLEKLNNIEDLLLEACRSKSLKKVAGEFHISLKTLEEWLSLREFSTQITLDKDWCRLVAEYYRDHSQRATASHFHISIKTLHAALELAGMPVRGPQEARALTKKNNLVAYGVEYATQREDIKQRIANTNIAKYGGARPSSDPAIRERIAKTKYSRYGSSTYNNSAQREQTCLQKYGTRSASGDFGVRAKIKQTSLDRYGVVNPSSSDEIKLKIAQTKQFKYGGYGWEAPSIRAKYNSTCQERYGVDWYCQTSDCRVASKNDSGPNRSFELRLQEAGICYEREFVIGKYSYDFRVGNVLIEIDPWITHNIDVHPYNKPVDKMYHREKSAAAKQAGYRCIHIWEWDDPQQVVDMLKLNTQLFGRHCIVCQVPVGEERAFLKTHHLQGYIKSELALGLYYKGKLVSLMTFGKPRYNKNYQWELLRYCSSCRILGGAEKLFRAFLSVKHPDSIVSYCDESKFVGEVYIKLGFQYLRSSVGCHWYNPKTKQRFTNNLVKARGVDQLLGTSYGKGTSNEQLLLSEGFVRIYDSGQATYVWSSEHIQVITQG